MFNKNDGFVRQGHTILLILLGISFVLCLGSIVVAIIYIQDVEKKIEETLVINDVYFVEGGIEHRRNWHTFDEDAEKAKENIYTKWYVELVGWHEGKKYVRKSRVDKDLWEAALTRKGWNLDGKV